MISFNTKNIQIIGTMTLCGALVGSFLGYGPLLKFKSIAVLAFDLETTEYRKFVESINNKSSFEKFSNSLSTKTSNLDNITDLRDILLRQQKWIEPLPKLSKQDTKDFGSTIKESGEDTLLGLRFTILHRDPQQAQQLTQLATDYAMDAALHSMINEAIRSAYSAKSLLQERAQVLKVKSEYEISSLQSRLKELRKIAQRYPESTKVDTRQLLSVENGGERYMPIPIQMAALETQVIDMQELIIDSDRDLKKYPVEVALLKQQIEVLDQSVSGKEAIKTLISITQQKLKAATEEWAREAYLENLNILADLRLKYVDQPIFLVQPSLPELPEQPRPLVFILLFALVAAAGTAAWLYRALIVRFFSDEARPMSSVS